VTATGVLPPDPDEPPPRLEPAVAATPATGAPAPAKQATAPRRERRVEQQHQPGGWQPWGAPQRQQERSRQNQGGFFGWFGGSRW
jgi:hypothetical protein